MPDKMIRFTIYNFMIMYNKDSMVPVAYYFG